MLDVLLDPPGLQRFHKVADHVRQPGREAHGELFEGHKESLIVQGHFLHSDVFPGGDLRFQLVQFALALFEGDFRFHLLLPQFHFLFGAVFPVCLIREVLHIALDGRYQIIAPPLGCFRGRENPLLRQLLNAPDGHAE